MVGVARAGRRRRETTGHVVLGLPSYGRVGGGDSFETGSALGVSLGGVETSVDGGADGDDGGGGLLVSGGKEQVSALFSAVDGVLELVAGGSGSESISQFLCAAGATGDDVGILLAGVDGVEEGSEFGFILGLGSCVEGGAGTGRSAWTACGASGASS